MKTIKEEVNFKPKANDNDVSQLPAYCLMCRKLFLLLVLLVATLVASAQDNSYIINKGDVLDIVVMEHPEFSLASLIVLPDGNIQYPGVGSIKVAGMSVQKLTSTMQSKLEKYVVNPVVTVFVRKIENQMINVLGYVNNPGQFQVYEEIDLLSALSMAGGVKNIDKSKVVIIIRANQKMETIKIKEYLETEEVSRTPVKVYVGDTVYVKEPKEVNWAKLSFFTTLVWAVAAVLNLTL
ncbi:MAG: polysaccharide biosynthesis/export family protein [Dysgonomonas sp.]